MVTNEDDRCKPPRLLDGFLQVFSLNLYHELLKDDGKKIDQGKDVEFCEKLQEKLRENSKLVISCTDFGALEALVRVLVTQTFEEEALSHRRVKVVPGVSDAPAVISPPSMSLGVDSHVPPPTLVPPPPPPPPPFPLHPQVNPLAARRRRKTCKAARRLSVATITHVSEESIWSMNSKELDQEIKNLILESDFENLFCIKEERSLQSSHNATPTAASVFYSAHPVVCLLDYKRSTNISISLSKFVKGPGELSGLFDRIEDVDLNVSDELLTALISSEPTNEEIELVNNYEGDLNQLNFPEKFVLEYSKHPQLSWMVRALCLFIKLPSWETELLDGISAFSTVFVAMNHSVPLRKLLFAFRRILELNNCVYDDQNHHRQMKGFEVNSIKEFSDTRTVNSQISLLEFVEERLPNISCGLRESLKGLEEAATFDFDALNAIMTDMRTARALFADTQNIMHEGFMRSAASIIREWSEKIAHAEAKFSNIRDRWNETRLYFHIDPNEMKPNNLLALWTDIISKLEAANHKRNRQ